jgi:hypothetical protein
LNHFKQARGLDPLKLVKFGVRLELVFSQLLMVTNVSDLSAESVVTQYKALAEIERGFKLLKSKIRPGAPSAVRPNPSVRHDLLYRPGAAAPDPAKCKNVCRNWRQGFDHTEIRSIRARMGHHFKGQ